MAWYTSRLDTSVHSVRTASTSIRGRTIYKGTFVCTTLIKTRMTHCSAKSSHNGLKAAVEGGGEEQVADIWPSRSHVSDLFPVDASASDVTMYEGGFSTWRSFHPILPSVRRGGEGRGRHNFLLSTTLPPVLVRRYLWHFPPALSAFAYAVLGTGDEPWRWLYSTAGKIRLGSLFVSTSFIFGFYIFRLFPPPFHFVFPYHFYSCFCASC